MAVPERHQNQELPLQQGGPLAEARVAHFLDNNWENYRTMGCSWLWTGETRHGQRGIFSEGAQVAALFTLVGPG